jgi:hypothetical protein
MNTCGATTAVWATIAAAHWQRSAAMAAVTPPGAGPGATLVAAHQLLCNPPSAHTSLSAVEQWHHEIDQLVVTAINTTPHGGGGVGKLPW